MHERRRERSENPWIAGDLYLQSIARRRGLDLLTLASSEGLLLSGAGDRGLGSRVAAIAPHFAEEPAALRPGLVDELTGGQPLQIWRLTIRDRPFYLLGLGSLTDMSEEVEQAFGRIFARPSPRALSN